MAVYKALVTNKRTKERVIIESDHETKADFIFDLRRNGYAVDSSKVKTKKEFDRIMETTNLEKWDWHPKKYDMNVKVVHHKAYSYVDKRTGKTIHVRAHDERTKMK